MSRKRKIISARQWWRIQLWWRLFAEDTIAPLNDQSARLQFVAVPIFLYLVLLAQGFGEMTTEALNAWAAFWALVYAIPLFVVWNAIGAVLRVRKTERELGVWEGKDFIFHEPKLLLTKSVTSEDNDKPIPFKITGVPRQNIYVELQIRKQMFDEDWSAQFGIEANGKIHALWDGLERPSMVKYLERDRTAYIVVRKPVPSNSSTVRVYLLSWTPG